MVQLSGIDSLEKKLELKISSLDRIGEDIRILARL
jgi:hypothetical protein